MRQLIMVGSIMCVGLGHWSYADDSKPKKADDLKLMQGTWKVVGIEVDGVKAPVGAVEGMRWTFNGTEMTAKDPGEEPGGKATITLDSSKTPKHFDAVSKDEKYKGQPVIGIYKFEKDQLIICTRDPDRATKGRPETFKTEAGSKLALITLERLKK